MLKYATIIFSILSIKFLYCQNDSYFILKDKLIFINENEEVNELNMNLNSLNLNEFKLMKIKNENFLLKNGSGILYKIKKDSIYRIDKSYDDKMHNSSLNFVYNDTLYMFGGYGNYHAHKTLVYFNQSTNEWELKKYKGFESIEGFCNVKFHFIKDNKLYVIGYNSAENEYQNEKNYKRKGFVFDFKNKEITETFNLDSNFIFPNYYYDIGNDKIVLFYNNYLTNLILDTSNLKFYEFESYEWINNIVSNTNQRFLIKNSKLFYVSKNINRSDELQKVDLNVFQSNLKTKDLKIKKDEVHILWFSILIFLPVFFIYTRNFNKVNVHEKYLKFRNKKIELNQESKFIIKILLDKKCSNKELIHDLNKGGLHINHVNRIKNFHINKINIDFNNKFKVDLILFEYDEFDKRTKNYFLNPQFIYVNNIITKDIGLK